MRRGGGVHLLRGTDRRRQLVAPSLSITEAVDVQSGGHPVRPQLPQEDQRQQADEQEEEPVDVPLDILLGAVPREELEEDEAVDGDGHQLDELGEVHGVVVGGREQRPEERQGEEAEEEVDEEGVVGQEVGVVQLDVAV